MKTTLFFYFILLLSPCLLAQKNEIIAVKAGIRVQDCISLQQRYRYPEFTDGKVLYKNGAFSAAKLNYNFLPGEMEYIQSYDTLFIANPMEIRLIAVAGDTFYFDKGYLEQISGGQVRVAVKKTIQLKETQNRDSYGSSGSNSAIDSYSSVQTAGKIYQLVVNEDRVFEKKSEFYLATSIGEFVPFKKKQIKKLFPKKKDAIEDYLKSNKVDFDSKDDLLKFADYLCTL